MKRKYGILISPQDDVYYCLRERIMSLEDGLDHMDYCTDQIIEKCIKLDILRKMLNLYIFYLEEIANYDKA